MRSAILFDIDGTLVDTPAGMTRVLRAVIEQHGRSATDERMRQTVGRPLAASLASLLELPAEHPDVTGAVEETRRLFTEMVIPSATDLVFPGVLELLAALREHGHPIAAVTSKVRRSAVELLGAAGLLDAFDTLSCHDMAEQGKPHADLALLAADTLGVAPRSCVVVGDAVDDIRMAINAAMDPLGITTGVATRDELATAGARAVVASIPALAEILLPAGLGPHHRALSVPLGSQQR